jgi:hypothetical protein
MFAVAPILAVVHVALNTHSLNPVSDAEAAKLCWREYNPRWKPVM